MNVTIKIKVCGRRLTEKEVNWLIRLGKNLQVTFQSEASVEFDQFLLPKITKMKQK